MELGVYWEDLRIQGTLVLVFRKYFQKYFIWNEELFKSYFTIYPYFILEVVNRVVNVCVGGLLNVSWIS